MTASYNRGLFLKIFFSKSLTADFLENLFIQNLLSVQYYTSIYYAVILKIPNGYDYYSKDSIICTSSHYNA